MVLLESGVLARADLTIAVDVATRTICAAVLRPVGTKAVDAALLLARMLVPEPMRPGWAAALRDVGVPCCRTPGCWRRRADGGGGGPAGDRAGHDRDRRREGVRLRHVHPRLRPAGHLGAAAHGPRTPTDKAVVEATFAAVNTLFCQHVAGYTGSNTHLRGDRVTAEAAWTAARAAGPARRVAAGGWQTPAARRAARPAISRAGCCRRTRSTPRWSPPPATCR